MSDKGFPWRTLAIVSLMINLLVVGAAIGFFASGGFARRVFAPERPPGILRSLPQEERRIVLRDLVGAWRESRDERRAAMEARQHMMEVARQEPFDETAMREALAGMRGADQAVLARYHETLLKTLGKLTAEQRVAALRAAGGRPGLGMPGPQRMRERDGSPARPVDPRQGPPEGSPPP